ncbi:MAG: IS3 family transposase [Candidatus Cybelea sp.]
MTALLGAGLSQRKACGSIGTSRASWNRWQKRMPSSPTAFHIVRSGTQPHALTVQERAAVLAVCNSERFYNSAPRAIVTALLDEGQYFASASTFYRILRAHGQVHERRAIATHPARIKPELVTTAPNQLWSWDVTKLPGPAKWTWFSLYLVLDVFSRYIVGWEIATTESTAIAKALFRDAFREQGVLPGQLHIHADGGAMMKAKSLALLFADLGISKSHSRPHTSNDNPYSEAHFKTLKYRPEFPEFFPSVQAARLFIVDFVRWYNHEHRHSGLAFHTPADVHYGRAADVLLKRNAAMQQARLQHPRRFHPTGPATYALANAVYINRPLSDQRHDSAAHEIARIDSTDTTTECLTNA